MRKEGEKEGEAKKGKENRMENKGRGMGNKYKDGEK